MKVEPGPRSGILKAHGLSNVRYIKRVGSDRNRLFKTRTSLDRPKLARNALIKLRDYYGPSRRNRPIKLELVEHVFSLN